MTTATNFFKKEGLILLLALAPILYLAVVWPSLPDTVPLHWNFKGEIDRWGSKNVLLAVVVGINLFMYALMLILPRIAARRQELEAMGTKYTRIRMVLQLFMAMVSVVIVLLSSSQDYSYKNYLLGGCFILFMLLFGNYAGSIRPNHFLGVRTPWTLQSDTVWRKTHHLAGRLLVGGALLGLVLLFALPGSWGIWSVVVVLVAALLVPAIYSFIWFRQEQRV